MKHIESRNTFIHACIGSTFQFVRFTVYIIIIKVKLNRYENVNLLLYHNYSLNLDKKSTIEYKSSQQKATQFTMKTVSIWHIQILPRLQG